MVCEGKNGIPCCSYLKAHAQHHIITWFLKFIGCHGFWFRKLCVNAFPVSCQEKGTGQRKSVLCLEEPHGPCSTSSLSKAMHTADCGKPWQLGSVLCTAQRRACSAQTCSAQPRMHPTEASRVVGLSRLLGPFQICLDACQSSPGGLRAPRR